MGHTPVIGLGARGSLQGSQPCLLGLHPSRFLGCWVSQQGGDLGKGRRGCQVQPGISVHHLLPLERDPTSFREDERHGWERAGEESEPALKMAGWMEGGREAVRACEPLCPGAWSALLCGQHRSRQWTGRWRRGHCRAPPPQHPPPTAASGVRFCPGQWPAPESRGPPSGCCVRSLQAHGFRVGRWCCGKVARAPSAVRGDCPGLHSRARGPGPRTWSSVF